MDDKNLDVLFREKLSNHETQPSPKAWARLEEQLEQSKKPLWLIWGNYAAGFLLLLGIGIGYQYWDQSPTDRGKEMITEIAPIQTVPVMPVDSVTAPIVTETPPIIEPIQRKQAPSQPTQVDKSIEQLAVVTSDIPERLVESLPHSDQREEVWAEALAFDALTLPSGLDEVKLENQTTENEIAYTVKIVSRGYAIAPDKGQLVDGIENKLEKIGGFFTKVDKGFGDLQDAKNDLLFQVMASKKEK